MTAVQILVTVQVDGADADDVARDLALLVEGGDLDHAALGMLRAYLAPIGGDWKVTYVLCEVAEGEVLL